MLQGFKDFIPRGNVVDLAVAVVIGVAFGTIENGPAEPTDVELLAEIRDLLRAQYRP